MLEAMAGRRPVLVPEMCWPKARMRWGVVHRGASGPREETSCCRRSQVPERAGQVRMACLKDSGSFPQRGQDVLGFLLNQEGSAAR